MDKALIIFLKYPELGRSKTRLAATIGDENALKVYIKLLDHTYLISNKINSDKYLYYDKVTENKLDWKEGNYVTAYQVDEDLGMRMKEAFNDLFSKGYKQVVIIGSDCYELSKELLEAAFDVLNTNEAVIGPAKDGGYYLLGLTKLIPELFTEIAWSTENVFNSTIKILQNKKITYKKLPVLSDIDIEEDLPDDIKKLIS